MKDNKLFEENTLYHKHRGQVIIKTVVSASLDCYIWHSNDILWSVQIIY